MKETISQTKNTKKASIILENLYIIIQAKAMHRIISLYMALFTYSLLIGSYSSLFWFQIKHFVFLYFIILSFQNKRNIYREHQIRKMSTTAISRSVIEMLQGIETAILIRKTELTMLTQTISYLRHHGQIKHGLWLYIKRRSDTDTQMEFLGKTPIPTSGY